MNFFSLFKRKLIYLIKKKENIDEDNINYNNLDDLFNFYGSDKSNIFKKNNSKGHGFSKFYIDGLKDLKKKKIKILEIGSYAGASAAAFSKYFNKSLVYCFDVNISKFVYKSKKIKVFGLDVNNKNETEKVLKQISLETQSNFFDVIIDDGSHYLSDILLSLKNLFKYVIKGGTYVIEDFKHPNYYKYNKDIDHIFMDQVLKNLEKKVYFDSSILNEADQTFLHENINKIDIFKGNLKNSDICFIKKN